MNDTDQTLQQPDLFSTKKPDSQAEQPEAQEREAHPPAVASRIAAAVQMLELFASVGAESFDITHTNLQQEKRASALDRRLRRRGSRCGF